MISAAKPAASSSPARLRSNVDSDSTLQFCAIVYYTDWSTAEQCTPVDGAAGEKGMVSAEVAIDPTRVMMWANIRMFQEGSAPLSMTLDNADARLDIVEPAPPPDSGGSGGGGGSSGGNGGSSGGGWWRRQRWWQLGTPAPRQPTACTSQSRTLRRRCDRTCR